MDVIVDISFSLKTHNAYHLSQGEELTETTQSIKTEDEYNSDRAPLLAKKDISSNTEEFVPMELELGCSEMMFIILPYSVSY